MSCLQKNKQKLFLKKDREVFSFYFYLVSNITLKQTPQLNANHLNVRLTYLRGLEIAELKEEDMPMV